jgi:hypothetical protein
MFIEGGSKSNETVLMSLTGNFDLNEISILTDKMRIPGGDDLKKATKEKNNMKTIYSITIFQSVTCRLYFRTDVAKVLCRKHGK